MIAKAERINVTPEIIIQAVATLKKEYLRYRIANEKLTPLPTIPQNKLGYATWVE